VPRRVEMPDGSKRPGPPRVTVTSSTTLETLFQYLQRLFYGKL